ncbi:hypothetical protein B0H15DRAFT_945722 [Mycena belliarum]|uniref:Uncharacterized protein n=1 Tax=Mycena belliarum TaxID=1033014 RepID=A0AAD6UFK1_9AGAR|nr:hypothetical protein B0H15DRAFT_945722 [Mycena belliae]
MPGADLPTLGRAHSPFLALVLFVANVTLAASADSSRFPSSVSRRATGDPRVWGSSNLESSLVPPPYATPPNAAPTQPCRRLLRLRREPPCIMAADESSRLLRALGILTRVRPRAAAASTTPSKTSNSPSGSTRPALLAALLRVSRSLGSGCTRLTLPVQPSASLPSPPLSSIPIHPTAPPQVRLDSGGRTCEYFETDGLSRARSPSLALVLFVANVTLAASADSSRFPSVDTDKARFTTTRSAPSAPLRSPALAALECIATGDGCGSRVLARPALARYASQCRNDTALPLHAQCSCAASFRTS